VNFRFDMAARAPSAGKQSKQNTKEPRAQWRKRDTNWTLRNPRALSY